jgi:hypothetical protein
MAHLELESLDHLLSSNNPPVPSELPTIHHIISAGRDRIAHLQTEISELRIAMERRIRELAETKDRVKKHAAIFSVVRRVPMEIMCEIFAWTLPNARRVDQYTIEHAPWRLGHICQRWRAAALGYPPLWSSIIIYGCPGLRIDDLFPPLMIEAQLWRSGGASLDVTFDFQDGDIVDFESSESLGLILGHSVCWDTARFLLHPILAGRMLNRLQRVKFHLPKLCSLEFISSSAHGLPIGDIFSFAPCLREVFLTGEEYKIISLPTNSHLPWSQITRFRGFYSA